MGVSQIPHVDHRVGLERRGSDQLSGLCRWGSVTATMQNVLGRVPHLRGVPRNSADSFASHVVESQALLLGLDIPDGHEASAAASDQDVCNLLIPVQAFDVIRTGRSRAQSEWVLNIV